MGYDEVLQHLLGQSLEVNGRIIIKPIKKTPWKAELIPRLETTRGYNKTEGFLYDGYLPGTGKFSPDTKHDQDPRFSWVF